MCTNKGLKSPKRELALVLVPGTTGTRLHKSLSLLRESLCYKRHTERENCRKSLKIMRAGLFLVQFRYKDGCGVPARAVFRGWTPDSVQCQWIPRSVGPRG